MQIEIQANLWNDCHVTMRKSRQWIKSLWSHNDLVELRSLLLYKLH